MDYCIRELRKSEFPLLEHFLYEAIFIPNDCGPVSPSVLAMSVDPDYRGLGIGTALLRAHLTALQKRGYARVSLSVQKANAALRLYRRLGFSVIGETEEEYVMAANLRP